MSKKQMVWGYSCPMYWEFQQHDKDPLVNKLKFLLAHDLRLASLGLSEVERLSAAQYEWLTTFLAEHHMRCFAHVSANWCDLSDDQIKQNAEKVHAGLTKHRTIFKDTIVMTISEAGERFDRSIRPLPERLERLSRALAPVAAVCHELGTPLGVENREDFYCSDLVALCQDTPHLGIFVDTGNTYLVGERPLPAIEAAAPYAIGGHFKDHRVMSNPKSLMFEVHGAVLGEGDVGLREAWQIIQSKSRYGDRMCWELEMICPKEIKPTECLQRSLAFVRSL